MGEKVFNCRLRTATLHSFINSRKFVGALFNMEMERVNGHLAELRNAVDVCFSTTTNNCSNYELKLPSVCPKCQLAVGWPLEILNVCIERGGVSQVHSTPLVPVWVRWNDFKCVYVSLSLVGVCKLFWFTFTVSDSARPLVSTSTTCNECWELRTND